jgi:hypothetical protein
MDKKYRYAHNPKNLAVGPGRRVDPSSWKYGSDDYVHESHYAYLKHRSQARFRGEDYQLTFEEWHSLWTPETLSQRGRSSESLVLTRINWDLEWSLTNVTLVNRKHHLKLNGQRRKQKRSV